MFRHWHFCKEANRRHFERQIFLVLSKSSGSLLFRRWLENDIADSFVFFSAVVSYQRVFLQPFQTFYFSCMKQQELVLSTYSPRVPDFCIQVKKPTFCESRDSEEKGKRMGLWKTVSRNIEGGNMDRMTGSKNPSAQQP